MHPFFPTWNDFARLERKVDLVVSLLHLTLSQEIRMDANVATIKQQIADLSTEVQQETDGEVALAKAFDGLIKQVSDLVSQLKVATANAGNPQDLADIASGLTAVLTAVHENRLKDAVLANTAIDPNAPPVTPPVQPAPAPSIVSISPTSGAATGGDTVTITGTGFTDALGVMFGDVPAASFMVNDDTSITAVTAPAAAPGSVSVVVNGPTGTSAENPQFTVA